MVVKQGTYFHYRIPLLFYLIFSNCFKNDTNNFNIKKKIVLIRSNKRSFIYLINGNRFIFTQQVLQKSIFSQFTIRSFFIDFIALYLLNFFFYQNREKFLKST